jgi:hypothetical protein
MRDESSVTLLAGIPQPGEMRHDRPVAMDPEPNIPAALSTVLFDAAHRCLAFAAPNPDEVAASVLVKRTIPSR